MKYLLTCLLVVFVCCSCSEHKPEFTISQDKMVKIMADMTVGEQVIRRYPYAVRDSVREELMLSLLKIHNVSQGRLDSNLYLYQMDIQRYSEMLTSLKNKIDSIDTD